MEREAEEIWTPPETELTKDRSKLRGRRLHTEDRIFIEIWGGKKVRRESKDGQRQRGIKWTARERGGSTGEDRGIPQWHFIPFSLFLAPLLPISLLFSPNKSFWLILNQLIPSRQLENCNNLSPTCNFSLSLPLSTCLRSCLVCLSLCITHTNTHTLNTWLCQWRWKWWSWWGGDYTLSLQDMQRTQNLSDTVWMWSICALKKAET